MFQTEPSTGILIGLPKLPTSRTSIHRKGKIEWRIIESPVSLTRLIIITNTCANVYWFIVIANINCNGSLHSRWRLRTFLSWSHSIRTSCFHHLSLFPTFSLSWRLLGRTLVSLETGEDVWLFYEYGLLITWVYDLLTYLLFDRFVGIFFLVPWLQPGFSTFLLCFHCGC